MKHPKDIYGKRIGAAVIDLLLSIALFVAFSLAFGETKTMHYADGGYRTQANLTGVPFLVYLCVILAYFTIMEWKFGASVGKLLTGIRVVCLSNGGHPSLKQSTLRNLLRIADAFPYFIPYATGIFVSMSNDYRQRLGDKAAGTAVAGIEATD